MPLLSSCTSLFNVLIFLSILVSPSQQFSLQLQRFKPLQNKFDIRGVALPKEGNNSSVNLSGVEAFFIGQAFARWVLLQHHQDDTKPITIAVGRDSRLTGPQLSYALLQGIELTRSGSALDLGLCTTPATFHACLPPPLGISALGSIMVTASHLPPDRNGMKFFQPQPKGGLTESDVSEIIALAAQLFEDQNGNYPAPKHTEKWHRHRYDFLDIVYGKHLIDLLQRDQTSSASTSTSIGQPLRGLHVLLNPGNGAGGFFINVLQACGAKTDGSLNLEPDGNFPNHSPNPEDRKCMSITVQAVEESEAQVGLVFDPDCDRLGIVEGGIPAKIINRNRLIALAAAIVLRDYPGTTIVTDSVTSEGLGRFIRRRGGKHLRYMKGYRNVIEKAIELNKNGVDCQLAIECSGHAAFKENRFLDDGAFLAVKLLREIGRSSHSSLSEIIQDLEEPVEYAELRIHVKPGYCRFLVSETVLELFKAVVLSEDAWKMEEENYEGLRARVDEGQGKSGWLHFRPSLHDPVISLTVESESFEGIKNILGSLVRSGMLNRTQKELNWSSFSERL